MTSEPDRALRACILRLLVKAADNLSTRKNSKGELHMTFRTPDGKRLRTSALSGAMDVGNGLTGTLPEILLTAAQAMSTTYGQLICRTMLDDLQGHSYTGVVLIASALFWDHRQGSLIKPAQCLIGIGVQLETGQQHALSYNIATHAIDEEIEHDMAEVTELVWSLAETIDNMRRAPMPENAFDIATELMEFGTTLHLGAGHKTTVGSGNTDLQPGTREWFMNRVGDAAKASGIAAPKPSRRAPAVTIGDPKTVIENFTKAQPDSGAGPVRYRNQ